MAIVPNKDGQGITANGHMFGPVDPSYCSPTVKGAANPTSAAAYASQVGLNTTTGVLYMATSTGGTEWIEKQ